MISYSLHTASFKGEGSIFHFSEKGAQRRGILYHIFYMVKIGIITAGGAFMSLAWMGMAKFDAPLDTAFEIQFDDSFSLPVPNIVSSYFLFIFIEIIKDAVCMNILHQIMHRRWYELHYVHHLPMKVRIDVAVYDKYVELELMLLLCFANKTGN